MMRVNIHLTFRGQCREALEFYEDLLGGSDASMLTYADSPMAADVPSDWQNKIVHGSLSVEGMTLAGADILPEQYVPPKGFFVLLEVEDPSEAERLFMELSEGGSVEMPVQQTFWSIRFGMLIDRFGIPWEINCVQEVE
ncbi:MAG: VOC family protein [Candidatus Hydrogenedentota bacterium]